MIHLDGYLHNHLGNKPLVFYLSYFSYCKYLFISNLREKEFIQIDNSIEGGEDMAAGEEGINDNRSKRLAGGIAATGSRE